MKCLHLCSFPQNLRRLSILSPAPHYPGNSHVRAGTYPGIYRILCPHRPRTYPGLMRGDIYIKKADNLLSLDVSICQDSDQRCPGLWGGELRGDLQEKCPRSSGYYPGLYLGYHKVQKFNPRASPRYCRVVGVGGSGLQLIVALEGTLDSTANLLESWNVPLN